MRSTRSRRRFWKRSDSSALVRVTASASHRAHWESCHSFQGMTWEIVLAPEVEEWYLSLDPQSSDNVTKAIGILEEAGPNLGRPLVDRLHSSKLHNLKELRTPSNNRGH